ncbi:zinc/manganese transport system ATP-binding protein [Amycolatopsis bartoniae]|uniref:ABC transporter ATP-binding protein n=1 Tax=Amycolatopsis bartoniae TaxID=941986 RepID=A0A8H9MCT7_9PSEU|nr:metal ABC transporter ATP-binding protein [Amycolatopsis bartoniae]MBB2935111.1 zinc/manganese transport system ATP-binding protein [Amycolatopsis bartoniae]TVT06991.1 metal ABC transporter ATP-binding protein [Amycolatopsis bartoniae]GHF74432.1 ABC transporter ATP-binding protein [Amycolatopsis bartoniae]
MSPAVEISGASLAFGGRTLWSGLDLNVEPGEFLAILGPNGSGKTSLVKVLLGLQSLSAGSWRIASDRPVGYVPQQRAMHEALTLRGVDLVGLGLDGHRWGVGLRGLRERRRRVAAAIESVGAQAYAKSPVGRLSGGEQQRLRVAQALIGDPDVLLCDEPLLSLDLGHQRAVSALIDRRRREAGTAVLFVTHELNPVLSYVDRVLYLVEGRFRIGTPEEVMNSKTLSELYRTKVEVLRVGGQIHVAGQRSALCEDEPHHLEPEERVS